MLDASQFPGGSRKEGRFPKRPARQWREQGRGLTGKAGLRRFEQETKGPGKEFRIQETKRKRFLLASWLLNSSTAVRKPPLPVTLLVQNVRCALLWRATPA